MRFIDHAFFAFGTYIDSHQVVIGGVIKFDGFQSLGFYYPKTHLLFIVGAGSPWDIVIADLTKPNADATFTAGTDVVGAILMYYRFSKII